MAGIFLISFNGAKLELNPAGDLLALLAAFVWACYSVLSKKISSYGFGTILTTRRVFSYGLLFMVPALFLFDFQLAPARLTNPVYLFNLLFLGGIGDVLCLVECCGESAGRSKNQRLYLHGTGHYRHHVRGYLT